MTRSSRKVVERQHRIDASYIEESPLYFFNKERSFDQKLGLTRFGPVDAPNAQNAQDTIRLGIIATGRGRQEVGKLLKKMSSGVESDNKNPLKSPPFQGMNNVFRCNILNEEKFNEDILEFEITSVTDILNYDRRVKFAAELYARKLGVISGRVSKPDVVLCYQTSELETSIGARASARVKNLHRLTAEEQRRLDQIRKDSQEYHLLSPLDQETLNMMDMLVNQDFELALKAECMKYEITTQIVSQSTIDEINRHIGENNATLNNTGPGQQKEARFQDPAMIAWNLAVGLYYKSGKVPWRVADLKEGTCYVGISFYIDQMSSSRETRTSLAQIFTDTGEGLVITGDAFKFSESEKYSPHLDKISAAKLIEDAMKLYKAHKKGQSPSRLVIHKSSEFWEAERQGFDDARGNVHLYDYIALRGSKDVFFVRDGTESILRGTLLSINKAKNLLYTTGYVPHLGVYPGPRIPIAMEISQHIGESSLEDVAREILALTRLNWNSANFYSALPMTLHFANRVKGILARIPDKKLIKNEYRYYM